MNSLNELESLVDCQIAELERAAMELEVSTREIQTLQQKREFLVAQVSKPDDDGHSISQSQEIQAQVQRCEQQLHEAKERESSERSAFDSAVSRLSETASEAERGASQTAAGAQHYSTGQHAGGRFNASSLQAIATRARNLAERCRRALAEAQSRVNSEEKP